MKINSAEILCVGTEILIGDIVNTNAAYISKKLAELGISQYHQSVVGDNPERLGYYLKESLKNCDLVITTGGLGPTYDDLTKETIAGIMGRKLILHEESKKKLDEFFAKRKIKMTENNEKQVYMPENSKVFVNMCGTAPGCAIEDEEHGKTVIILPGPPREMKAMFERDVIPYLSSMSEEFFFSKNINIFGMGESAVEYELKDLIRTALNPTVAPYAYDGETRLRVTARAETETEAQEMCKEMCLKIEKTEVGKYIYGYDSTLENELVKMLKEKGLTVAFAESCTGGGVSKALTSVSGSSDVFLGSVISYSNDIKHKVLKVTSEVLEKYGAVSSECAEQMADGVRKFIGSDIGVSITGIAGPTGGTEEKPVGTVYFGVSTKNAVRSFRINTADLGREWVRNVSEKNALSAALCEAKMRF